MARVPELTEAVHVEHPGSPEELVTITGMHDDYVLVDHTRKIQRSKLHWNLKWQWQAKCWDVVEV